MARNFQAKKQLIIGALALVIAVDIALGAYSWKLGTTHSAQQELAALTLNRDLLKKDIQRAQEIRRHIPDIQKDCAAFEESLLPANSVYSAVTSELSAIAAAAGLRLDSRNWKESEIKGQKRLSELSIDAQVSGDYRGVVRFLNGLQRSSNFYAVEELAAQTANKVNGPKDLLKVKIHIKTYVRAT
jgi:Tfp pilus assembly protein PilO